MPQLNGDFPTQIHRCTSGQVLSLKENYSHEMTNLKWSQMLLRKHYMPTLVSKCIETYCC